MRTMVLLAASTGFLALSAVPGSAQTADIPAVQTAEATDNVQAPISPAGLTTQLNASDICTPLALNINDITSLFGVAIPSYLPIDPNIRWNQNAHTVENFIANEGSFEATINIGCQPSSNGMILDFIGLTADKVRLPGRALCAGAIDETGTLAGTDCTIEGRITPYVGKTFDLEGRVERALTASTEAVLETAPQPQ